jgi:hypothetical protein
MVNGNGVIDNMVQQDLDPKVWEKKDIRMARMNSITNATNFVTACVNAGIFKPKDMNEALTELNGYRNRIFDWIYEDMDKGAFKGTETPRQAIESEYRHTTPSLATDKQVKAVWAIIYGNTGNPELEDELPEDISKNTLKHLTFDQASNFIEKYGIKK